MYQIPISLYTTSNTIYFKDYLIENRMALQKCKYTNLFSIHNLSDTLNTDTLNTDTSKHLSNYYNIHSEI